jgi:hypothetical protein
MKNLLLILLLFCSGLVSAQQLSKKKVDPKTGDTTQFTRERTLYNPTINYILDLTNFIGWRIEKISAKEHQGDTILLFLRIVPGKNFQLSKDSSLIHITFADGHTHNFKADSVWEFQYGGLEYTSPKSSNIDIFATYALTPADINALIAQPVTALRLHTSVGPVDYSISHKNAVKIQKILEGISK